MVKFGILRGLVLLAAWALSMQAMAFMVTVDIAPKLFWGLGKCGGTIVGLDTVSAPPFGEGACDGNPVPELTSQNALSTMFPLAGWDASDTTLHEFDMIYMHVFSFSADSSIFPANVTFDADSAAGGTGGLSAGPCAPGPVPDCGASLGLVHDLSFKRAVIVNSISYDVIQLGSLLVTWGNLVPADSDFLTLYPVSLADVPVFEGAVQVGTLTINFDGITNLIITADPEADQSGSIVFTPAAIPIPSSLALLGLGLAGIGLRRRQAH